MPLLTPNQDAEVSISNRGTLKIKTTTNSLASGTSIITETVPVGKVWSLKNIFLFSDGTSSSRAIVINDGTQDFGVYSASTFSASEGVPIPQVSIPAGWSISTYFYMTSGSTIQRTNLLYQEFDA